MCGVCGVSHIIPCVPCVLSIDENDIDWRGWKKHAFTLKIMFSLIQALCKFHRICMRLSQLSKIQPAECQKKTIHVNTDKLNLSQRLQSQRGMNIILFLIKHNAKCKEIQNKYWISQETADILAFFFSLCILAMFSVHCNKHGIKENPWLVMDFLFNYAI